MNRSWPVHVLLVLFASLVPEASSRPGTPAPDAVAEIGSPAPASTDPLNDPNIPAAMQEVIARSHSHYMEGSNLLKSGESVKARAEFNEAVDLVLQSDWNLSSTPALNRFFQDLIYRIQQDESRYLQPPESGDEKPESAVVDELEKLDLIPIRIDASLTDVVAADLANTKYDIPVTLNEQVLKSLNYWLNRGRRLFTDGLLRSGRYRGMIERIFREESLPLDLMYLAQVESLFKTNALSRARAKGMWQFARWTAIRYGLKVNGYIDERSDPEKSTRAAARYLNDLYGMFNDWNLVLAAYNCGEAKVQRLVSKSGLNDFWGLLDRRRNFPQETKNHVPLIMASVILGRNPERYGFPKELDPPESYDLVTVSRSVALKAAARILNIPVEELKALNPALRNYCTPPDYEDFELKVPAGTEPELCQQVAALPPMKFKPAPEFAGRYRVRPGDTLGHIARRFRISVAELQEINGIRSPKALRAGNWLYVPSLGAGVGSKRTPSSRASRKTQNNGRKSRTSITAASAASGALKSGIK